ncbi:FAD-binding oxidoreductase [Sphaerisporangium rubeum]|uniref:FAD/FMN-containing dehydrogenase n=1 Tax=Sphaerisporangium rubeum TaxID=321317 RepID=A0A7X0IF73_9ACTN|nr:FAD-binding oxidoreductase [Sphaerisporangium rubeum]MBB6473843.1 FAD/FMN-containing dehydrogenase [Sphaerisporangium rubeum]
MSVAGGGVWRRLRAGVAGVVHLPGDGGYDQARRALYDSVDPWPVAVVEAGAAGDVRAAVEVAAGCGVPVVVQATGHGTHVPCDGAVLVRTGRLDEVVVDAAARVARVGPGARWGQVVAAAAAHGLAPLCGSSPDVGVTGFTLGGGVGWLARRYGFAADSVTGARVVTADGREVAVDAARHADLFWALRGGGGSFGVVTSLTFRLYPVREVYAGAVYFAAERAAEVLGCYREWTRSAPDWLSTAVLLRRMPDSAEVPAAVRGRGAVVLKALSCGGAERAERVLRPLRAVGGPVLYDDVAPVPFGDAAMGGVRPAQVELAGDLPDGLIGVLAGAVEGAGSPVSAVEVRHWGGAMARPAADAGPVGHRGVPLSVTLDERVPHLVEGVAPYVTGGSFLNFLDDPSRVESAYTAADWRALREVRRAWDPGGVFGGGLTVPPADPVTADPVAATA